jgi:hypothetical protein
MGFSELVIKLENTVSRKKSTEKRKMKVARPADPRPRRDLPTSA